LIGTAPESVLFGTRFTRRPAYTARMITILIVIVVLMLVGAIPSWPHSRSWGYGPSGGLGLVLLILLILLLTGRL
jgi:hypothetical protein